MRSIRRSPARIPTLYAENGSGRKKANAVRDLFQAQALQVKPNGSINITFPDHWNKADVRGALYAQQGRACAFCGRELPEGDRGDVEHFRPKGKLSENNQHGGYWWLAYEFDNYVLSCRTCNSTHKGSRFPLRTANAVWVTYETRSRLANEARLLLDPGVDPMEELIQVEWQSRLCKVLPAATISGVQRKQVQGMIDFFKLNVRHQLVRERFNMAKLANKLIDEEKLDEASLLAVRYRPQSLVARQILIDRDLPEFLPDPQMEFQWLFNDIFEELLGAMEILESEQIDFEDYRPFNELLWSLAALVADPRPGSPSDLPERLDALGLLELVNDLVQQMA